jgi:hypothetical protein
MAFVVGPVEPRRIAGSGFAYVKLLTIEAVFERLSSLHPPAVEQFFA